jgi:hypothetical protein
VQLHGLVHVNTPLHALQQTATYVHSTAWRVCDMPHINKPTHCFLLLCVQELSALMSSKASRDDMRAVLGRAVGLALEAYRGSAGDADSSGASRTR